MSASNAFRKELELLRSDLGADRCDLSGRMLSGLNLVEINLSNCNLSGCDFSKTDLSNADFSDSNLAGASFINAIAKGAIFHRAELSSVDMEGVDLTDADFSHAMLSGADFSGTVLTKVKMDAAQITGVNFSNAHLPEGFFPSNPSQQNMTIEKKCASNQEKHLKILLTMPTWTDDLGVFSRIGRTRNPQVPLGLLYLASLAENLGHVVEFIDCDVEDVSVPDLVKKIQETDYDLVGLSATSPIYHKALKMAEAIKMAVPDMKIIIGGDHINIAGAEVFYECFDFAAKGEAEETWPEFLQVFAKGRDDFSDVDGLLWRKNRKVMINKPRRLFPDLDLLPFPAVHLAKMDKYRMSFSLSKNRNIGKFASIMMSRGCPFKCSFCSESSDVKYAGKVEKMRIRTPKNIVDEIEYNFRTHDIRHYFFMDSNITIKKKHTVELCNEILARKLPITFEGWTRANLINEELMTLMTQAGLVRLSCGIESGDPEILKIIKKDVPLQAVRDLFRISKKCGIELTCSAMLGNPGDTKKSVEKTINFLNSIPELTYTNFSIANPYPGTEMLMWARAGKYGLRLRYDELSKYTRYDDSPVEVNDLSAQDLVRYQTLGLIKIHLKPKRIIAAYRLLGFNAILLFFINVALKSLKKLTTPLMFASRSAR